MNSGIRNRAITLSLWIGLISQLAGCGTGNNLVTHRSDGPVNLFNIDPQIVAGDSIRSIQFHPVGNSAAAPILKLDERNQLQLRFESLSNKTASYRVTISHHNPDWSRSNLSPERFLNGFQTLPLNNVMVSSNNRPAYRQYSFTFPTEQFQITKSGNYLLKVENSDTGYLVLSLPFFVSENEGTISSTVEEITVPRQNMRRMHRPVSRFVYPDFVNQPQFDLQFYFAQNRFWGRSEKAEELDFSSPNYAQFEVTRNNAFIGDYEFNLLTLDQLSQTDNNVIEAYPTEIPPRLILRDDAEGFSTASRINLAQLGPFGNPDMSLNAGYANVIFRFDMANQPDTSGSVHLLGDFNNWSVGSNNKLTFDDETGRWKSNMIIKKGTYKYKYVFVKDDSIEDLYFDNQFTNIRQQYHAFVYMRDPVEFYYRLLQVQTFFSE